MAKFSFISYVSLEIRTYPFGDMFSRINSLAILLQPMIFHFRLKRLFQVR